MEEVVHAVVLRILDGSALHLGVRAYEDVRIRQERGRSVRHAVQWQAIHGLDTAHEVRLVHVEGACEHVHVEVGEEARGDEKHRIVGFRRQSLGIVFRVKEREIKVFLADLLRDVEAGLLLVVGLRDVVDVDVVEGVFAVAQGEQFAHDEIFVLFGRRVGEGEHVVDECGHAGLGFHHGLAQDVLADAQIIPVLAVLEVVVGVYFRLFDGEDIRGVLVVPVGLHQVVTEFPDPASVSLDAGDLVTAQWILEVVDSEKVDDEAVEQDLQPVVPGRHVRVHVVDGGLHVALCGVRHAVREGQAEFLGLSGHGVEDLRVCRGLRIGRVGDERFW